MTESQLQRAVARLLDHSGLLWYHGPNEGRRNPRTGAALKAAGMKAGFPDCVIFDPPQYDACAELLKGFKGKPRGLAIELKVGRNKPTASQLKWQDDLRARGWRVEVCRTMDDVMDLLRECYPMRFA